MDTVKKLIRVARPVSWPNTAYPFAAGYLITVGSVDWRLIVGSLFFLIPYNLLMYGVNDVFDYESDIRNPRKGSIEGAVEQRQFHPTILRAALITTLPFVAVLLITGSAITNFSLIVLLFFVVAYSLPGLRFKERPVLDSITSSIHFVGPLMYALSFTHFPVAAWPYVIAFFLWGLASHAFGAIQDIIPDREGGLASIATIFGARFTVVFVGILYTISSILVLAQGGLMIGVGLVGLIYLVNILPYRNISDKTSAASNRGWRRFIWLNLFAGMVVTLSLILMHV